MQNQYSVDSDKVARLETAILEAVEECGFEAPSVAHALMHMIVSMESIPKGTFQERPEYVRQVDFAVVASPQPSITSTHSFFSVLEARSSRRDFDISKLDSKRFVSVMAWTAGKRGTALAYDRAGAPLRYIPSAGGLNCIDIYAIANNVEGIEAGTYYYDYDEGLKLIRSGRMIDKVAEMYSQPRWLRRSAAVLVFVANIDRLEIKYGSLAARLALVDAGVAVGHAELVANALELRATILGALPSDELGRVLEIDHTSRVPLVSLSLGTRGDVNGI